MVLTNNLAIFRLMLTGMRTCSVLSLSRNVTVFGVLLQVSKSMVTPKGMAISSVRAYLRPMDPVESSILDEIFSSVRSFAVETSQRNKYNKND